MSVIGQRHVRSHCVHMLVICHFFFFFLSAMQRREEERSILTSLFPGRLILFFQIRALTGFWYCILIRFRSGLSFFFFFFLLLWCTHNLESEGMDYSPMYSTYGSSKTTRGSGYNTSLDQHRGLRFFRSTRESLNVTSFRSLLKTG